MNTWPNRGASGGPCGGLEDNETEQSRESDQAGLTQANRPPRNPVRFTLGCAPGLDHQHVLLHRADTVVSQVGHGFHKSPHDLRLGDMVQVPARRG